MGILTVIWVSLLYGITDIHVIQTMHMHAKKDCVLAVLGYWPWSVLLAQLLIRCAIIQISCLLGGDSIFGLYWFHISAVILEHSDWSPSFILLILLLSFCFTRIAGVISGWFSVNVVAGPAGFCTRCLSCLLTITVKALKVTQSTDAYHRNALTGWDDSWVMACCTLYAVCLLTQIHKQVVICLTLREWKPNRKSAYLSPF